MLATVMDEIVIVTVWVVALALPLFKQAFAVEALPPPSLQVDPLKPVQGYPYE